MLRANGMQGYVLFTAPDLNDSHAQKELYNLKGLVKPIRPSSIKFNSARKTVFLKTKPTFKVSFTPSETNPKSAKYSSSNSKIATVNSSGKITPKKAGTVTITAKASNGKTAKMTVNVKKFKKFKAKITKTVTVRSKAKTASKKMATLKPGKKVTINKVSANGAWGQYKKNRWIPLSSTNKG